MSEEQEGLKLDEVQERADAIRGMFRAIVFMNRMRSDDESRQSAHQAGLVVKVCDDAIKLAEEFHVMQKHLDHCRAAINALPGGENILKLLDSASDEQ